MLGEKIKATVNAKYYFGAPVTKAKVKYKVTRTTHDPRWYPLAPLGLVLRHAAIGGLRYDYTWYPGWRELGLHAAAASWWWGRGQQPPELVAEQTVEIGAGRHGRSRDRHGDRQGDPPGSRPQVHRSRPKWSINRGARSSARAKCWSPASRSRCSPGSIAATTASATRSARASTPTRSTRSRCKGTGKVDAAQDQLQGRQARSRPRSRQVGLEHRRSGHGRAADRRLRGRPISPVVQAHRRKEAHDRRGLHLHDHRRRLRRLATSASIDLELIPDKQRVRAGRDGQAASQHRTAANGTVLLFVRPANGVYLRPKIVRLQGQELRR